MPTIAVHELDINQLSSLGMLKDPVYNGFDSCITHEIDEKRQGLSRNDTLIYDFERALQAPVLEMMSRGFRVDIEEREKAILMLERRKEQTEKILSAIISATGFHSNAKTANSGKQLAELFYSVMKLKKIRKFVNGEEKLPMDRETLEKLSLTDRWAEPLINGILFHRDLSKSLQVLETEIDNDWRWRCSYNIGGTSTGRFSSSKSPFTVFNEQKEAWRQTGSNFQNISEELRRVFIPDPGYKLYGIDKAQSEARDVGWFCGIMFGDWTYLDLCESGDLHTNVTRMLYPEWEWTNDARENRKLAERRFYRLFTFRDASKRLGHATNYLGTPKEISRQTRIPLDLVETFQRRYFDALPCIRKMHQWVPQQLQRKRYLVNSFGRRRDFFDRPESSDVIKGAVAYLFQSATADCVNLGLWKLWRHRFDKVLNGDKIQILSQLHDAIYFQAPITNEADEKQMLRDVIKLIEIEQYDPRQNRRMKIPGEIVSGFNWAHRFRLLEDGTKEEWNPRGLDGIRL